MDPEQQEAIGGGMSRAAKKRARKKNKNKSSQQQPTAADADEDTIVDKKEKKKKRQLMEDAAAHTSNNKKKESKAGGILKKSKYSAAPTEHKNGSHGHQSNNTQTKKKDPVAEEDTEEDGDGGAVDLDGIVLGDDIQELLKSGEINLKDILLLENKNSKKKAPPKAEEENDDEMEGEDENPFQELSAKERARCALNFLLAPADLTAEDFYEEYWEKKALCVQAPKHRKRFDGFLSLRSIRRLTEKQTLLYGRDLNVTRYHAVKPGQPKRRANIDPPPFEDSQTGQLRHVEAESSFVWEQYDEKKATIRLLCPHKHNDSIHSLLSLFELEWGCMVGANAYLTPSGGSQGFGESTRLCYCMCELYEALMQLYFFEISLSFHAMVTDIFVNS